MIVKLKTLRDALLDAVDAIDAVLAVENTPLPSRIYGVITGSRIIRLYEVKRRTGMSRSFIYSGIKSGTFPNSVAMGARAVGWDVALIEQWIQERLEK